MSRKKAGEEPVVVGALNILGMRTHKLFELGREESSCKQADLLLHITLTAKYRVYTFSNVLTTSFMVGRETIDSPHPLRKSLRTDCGQERGTDGRSPYTETLSFTC
mmetsp:Transcript_5088/g.12145  ORF Transcript_5088/g.12145 Transcript_5088/m.12145 type:complete len:106 (-) Transcript_5088:780-1097(-)